MNRFRCPDCGNFSTTMELTEEFYDFSNEEIKEPVFSVIGHEVLLCKCGKKLTWFDMEKV